MAPVITIMGNIGSGKSAQAKLIAEDLGWETFSTGQLIRESGNKEIIDAHNQGELAPTEFVQQMILNKVESIDGHKGVILDGSPRMLEEAERYDQDFPKFGRKLNLVIVLKLDKEEAINRLKLRGRVDDTPEAIASRFETYETEVKPVINRYKQAGIVREVDGHGSVAEVKARILKVVQDEHLG